MNGNWGIVGIGLLDTSPLDPKWGSVSVYLFQIIRCVQHNDDDFAMFNEKKYSVGYHAAVIGYDGEAVIREWAGVSPMNLKKTCMSVHLMNAILYALCKHTLCRLSYVDENKKNRRAG